MSNPEESTADDAKKIPVIPHSAYLQLLQQASQGDADAMIHLGEFYANGFDSTEDIPNYKEATKWYKEAARRGSAKAMYALAVFYLEELKTYTEAMPWLLKAANELENMDSMRMLANLYKDEDSPLYDMEKYEYWLMKCGRNGSPESLYELGNVMAAKPPTLKGSDAAQWFEKAAKQGHVPSMYQLGLYYSDEDPQQRDMGKSYHWHLLAADNGWGASYLPLGQFYMVGEGVKKDYVLAYALYLTGEKKSESEEDQNKARQQAYILKDSMRGGAIKEAEELAEDLLQDGKVTPFLDGNVWKPKE